MPSEVNVGEEFNITLNVKNNQPIVGFECSVTLPYNLKIVNFSGNSEIKKMAGKFYQEKITDNGCIVKFAFFNNPITTDFHIGKITVKVLSYNNNTRIKIISKGADGEGNKIDIFSGDLKLKIKKENNEEEKSKNETKGILSAIIDFIKRLFGLGG
jgi:hypothetical protein